MDINGVNFHLSETVSVENMTAVEDDWSTLFINYAAIAWHEMRRAWRGDESFASQRKPRGPIIDSLPSSTPPPSLICKACDTLDCILMLCGWSNSEADLFSSKEPFDRVVPLSKMVEFEAMKKWQLSPSLSRSKSTVSSSGVLIHL